MQSVHMICNAHLDPVWLWEWEEGAAEALSTFRVAAEFCEQFDGFVFNHNEVILYQWVEEYEPALFKRIQKLVKKGKWHIMGGWYLQPDCNMPCGESFVRQIMLGRRYFKKKFDKAPTTAINFDPFGHTRGLVQILAKSGYDSYLFTRPGRDFCTLEKDQFIWVGYDGSRVLATRAYKGYLTHRGKALEKLEDLMRSFPDAPCLPFLWGVGNHGGGPSRIDLRALTKAMKSERNTKLVHSTPEMYFDELRKEEDALPVRKQDLNPWGPGCYTSQIRLKQKHRRLENELFSTEKMATAAWSQSLMPYPQEELAEAMRGLATCQFHDILPGSSIQPVEDTSLRLMDHALENLSRVKARAFFALSQGMPKARAEEIPVLVYNPHPFPVKAIVECEFQLADQNRAGTFTQVQAYQKDKPLPTQVEKELSNITVDWRKRVAVRVDLAPFQMNRFDCQSHVLPAKPGPKLKAKNGRIVFKTQDMEVAINTRTGLIDQYRVKGVDYLEKGACRPLVIEDDEDAWGTVVRRFRERAGAFKLLSRKDSARFSGVRCRELKSVRVIEDGPVRSVIEAVFGYGDSFLCQRYKLPREGTEIEIEVRVHWNEKNSMLKLSIPTPDHRARIRGQVAYGSDFLFDNGDEYVAQKWVTAVSEKNDTALTVVNDGIYGGDFRNGEIRLSLVRSPAYSGHPVGERSSVPQDRYTPRIDQGERLYHFWLKAGTVKERLALVDREALVHNEKPMKLSFFPSGQGAKPKQFAKLNDKAIQMTVAKRTEDGSELILRFFEPTGRKRSTTVLLPFAGMKRKITLNGFEIRTYKVNMEKRAWTEVGLTEDKRQQKAHETGAPKTRSHKL
ncbi:glycoside hydrolase family 38 C-terminal domain-containing protein [Candidatus Hydrogenedentota bacterium]